MSLVSNFIGGISQGQLGEQKKVTPDFDLNDNTFANLLEKQMKTSEEMENIPSIPQLGMPAGFNIEPLEGFDNIVEEVNKIEETPKQKYQNLLDTNNDGDITASETVTFFTSLLDQNKGGKIEVSDLFDFAKKQATNFYNKYSRDVITDVNEFVDDVKGMI